jgi:hypothetical protein
MAEKAPSKSQEDPVPQNASPGRADRPAASHLVLE